MKILHIDKFLGGLLILLLFLASCSRGPSEQASQAEPPTGSQGDALASAPPMSTDMATDMGTSMSTVPEPVDDEPIEAKIDRVIEQAKETKEQYQTFRDRMFDEAFAQIDTVLCSAFRLHLLSGKEKSFYKKDPDLYISSLRQVLKRQAFIALQEDRVENPPLGTVFPVDVSVSIPKSEPYNKRQLQIARLMFRTVSAGSTSGDSGLSTDMPDHLVTEQVTESQVQEAFDRVGWYFDPVEKCDPSYLEPVVNSAVARKESSDNMATLIAVSLRNLRSYPAKLETAEREWTRASDLELLLLNLKKNLAFKEVDPTAQRSVRGYERELSEAIDELRRAQEESRSEPDVDPKEVKGILSLFR